MLVENKGISAQEHTLSFTFFTFVGRLNDNRYEEETYLFFIGSGWRPFTVDGGGRSASVAFSGYERQ